MYCLLYSLLIPQNTFGICSFWPDIVLFSGAIHAILSFPPTCPSNTTKICTIIGPMTTTIPWRTTKTLKTIMARTGAIYEDTIALKLKLNSCVAIIRNRVFCFFKTVSFYLQCFLIISHSQRNITKTYPWIPMATWCPKAKSNPIYFLQWRVIKMGREGLMNNLCSI